MTTYNILSDEERDALRGVPCTSKQAKRIVRRGKWLRAALHTEGMRDEYIGCPHCGLQFPCETCSYPGERRFRCCHYTFGGSSYHADSAVRTVLYIGARTESVNKEEFENLSAEEQRKVLNFIEGHIEWGERVLDGTL